MKDRLLPRSAAVFAICATFAAFAAVPSAAAFFGGGTATAEKASAVRKTSSTPVGFTDDLDAARARAARENKLVFAVFSGSDWCGWCRKLEEEVLSKPEFVKGAEKDFVLVFIDSPNDKSLLSEHAKSANPKLTGKYDINGFPTVLILDAKGKQVAQTGYEEGGPAAYLNRLAATLAAARRTAALAEAVTGMKAGSPERVKALDAVLAGLDAGAQKEHEEWVREVLAADPDGTLGYRGHYPYFVFVAPLEERAGQLHEACERASNEVFARVVGDKAALKKMPKAERRALLAKARQAVAAEVLPGYIEQFAALSAEARKTVVPVAAKERMDGFAEELDQMMADLRSRIEAAQKTAAKPASAASASENK